MIATHAWLRRFLREGKQFRNLLQDAEGRQSWTADQLSLYQLAELRSVLIHAANNTPFYRDTFKSLGLNPARAPLPECLASLPYIQKADILADPSGFKSQQVKRTVFRGYTSGTTGTPLALEQDLYAINRENAFIRRQMHWAGYRDGDRRAWIRGDMVAPASQALPPFWRYNRTDNMLMMSSYHMSEANASAYLKALEEFDPSIIMAYPSSIGFFAAYLASCGKSYGGKSLQGIITSSETLDASVRASITSNFGCTVFDWYGQFERVAAIGTCEYGVYHLMSDYSYVEFLQAEEGLHEIIGTGFNNLVNPLIRYRTGDYVELAPPTEKCLCGRAFPVIRRIEGRRDDVLKLPDGRRIGRLDHIFKGVSGVLESQIVQESLERIIIYVVPGIGFSEQTRNNIHSATTERLGNAVKIEVNTVESIPRTRSGKLRSVICKI